jgi:hypothetical protein
VGFDRCGETERRIVPLEDTLVWVLVGLIGAVAVVLLLVKCIVWARTFSQELWYLNCEIQRTQGKEQNRWKRRKRKLLLSILPFVRYK